MLHGSYDLKKNVAENAQALNKLYGDGNLVRLSAIFVRSEIKNVRNSSQFPKIRLENLQQYLFFFFALGLVRGLKQVNAFLANSECCNRTNWLEAVQFIYVVLSFFVYL